ncbi:aspartic proteinase nepenthesin-1 [Phtheirospermum japonicum]|uniref:Aspartic proteinase nepenthesin-1 n=1 Tax=Phtheirospermum japonicum TaxID=374723 RepID=A0A830CPV1_9LAMI|nr:aspartic proteinase nepenthesin-1 [Phtheirospermum japonicum]
MDTGSSTVWFPWNTRGLLLSESLTFPELSVDNFTVGCSVSSVHVPEGGIVGFGRTGQSLPSQMDLESFSYCLQLQDNTTVSSDLVLTTKETKGSRATEYTTPFLQNPNVSSHPAFLEYYYVSVQKICVGKVNVKVPSGYLVPATNGSGGTIVDSGTTLTFMEKPMFDLVAREFVKQVANNYSRATEAEKELGLGLCYDVSGKQSLDYIPGLSFYFQGGGKMVLPLENYIVRYSGGICLAIITSIPAAKGKVWQGPAMILGNILQQNFYMDYDLKNNRLGFQKQECKRG